MNLSSLVHTGHYHREQEPQIDTRSQVMASSLVMNPYNTQTQTHMPSYTYVTAPQPPPSPPADETSKCSLPSISSLLGLADGSSPQESQPQQSAQTSSRPGSAYQQYGPSPAMSSRGALPPTPPMQSDSGFDGRQSPSNTSISGYSVASAPGYYFNASSTSSVIGVEQHPQRQNLPNASRRVSMPSTSISYAQSQYNIPQYSAATMQQPVTPYYSNNSQPIPPQPQVSGLYYQRPLPQQFPPPLMPVSVTLTPSSGANMWQHQHHHYISPSSAASFPQSQDRYICQTCNKAFSRPSSLRIHSHSHTGEKPFKCPHQGCGKAFSVRSNMKRHERGCHTFDGSALL